MPKMFRPPLRNRNTLFEKGWDAYIAEIEAWERGEYDIPMPDYSAYLHPAPKGWDFIDTSVE